MPTPLLPAESPSFAGSHHVSKRNKTNVSAATSAKLSAKLKAFWAAKKAGKK